MVVKGRLVVTVGKGNGVVVMEPTSPPLIDTMDGKLGNRSEKQGRYYVRPITTLILQNG